MARRGVRSPVRIADDWCIHVTNDCDTVPPQMLQTLKDAYQRGATTSKGSGLGLAISEKIAQKSGGSLELLLARNRSRQRI